MYLTYMPIAKWIPRRGTYVDQYLYTTDYSQVTD